MSSSGMPRFKATTPAGKRRTAAIQTMAREGIRNFRIAHEIGVSVTTVERTLAYLRAAQALPPVPWCQTPKHRIDWTAARATWFDLSLPVEQAATIIGANATSCYRVLGGRWGRHKHKLVPTPAPIVVTKPQPYSMAAMRGPDPFARLRRAQVIQAGAARV